MDTVLQSGVVPFTICPFHSHPLSFVNKIYFSSLQLQTHIWDNNELYFGTDVVDEREAITLSYT
jgi:hypothetical protein